MQICEPRLPRGTVHRFRGGRPAPEWGLLCADTSLVNLNFIYTLMGWEPQGFALLAVKCHGTLGLHCVNYYVSRVFPFNLENLSSKDWSEVSSYFLSAYKPAVFLSDIPGKYLQHWLLSPCITLPHKLLFFNHITGSNAWTSNHTSQTLRTGLLRGG